MRPRSRSSSRSLRTASSASTKPRALSTVSSSLNQRLRQRIATGSESWRNIAWRSGARRPLRWRCTCAWPG
eukprot:3868415-Pyramimonas_sp.AAC.1